MKVYLSRSNAANPAVFSIVKDYIEDLGHTIVEFEGGAYSHEPMLKCDALVIIPNAQMLPPIRKAEIKTTLTDDQPFIGKGQYEQCRAFVKEKADYYTEQDDGSLIDIELPDKSMLLLVQEVNIEDPNNPSIYVHNVDEVHFYKNVNWKNEYGFIEHMDDYVQLSILLGRVAPVNQAIWKPISTAYTEVKSMSACAKYLGLL